MKFKLTTSSCPDSLPIAHFPECHVSHFEWFKVIYYTRNQNHWAPADSDVKKNRNLELNKKQLIWNLLQYKKTHCFLQMYYGVN